MQFRPYPEISETGVRNLSGHGMLPLPAPPPVTPSDCKYSLTIVPSVVEATMLPGSQEQLVLTGMMGDVMRESVQAALSYLRFNAGKIASMYTFSKRT